MNWSELFACFFLVVSKVFLLMNNVLIYFQINPEAAVLGVIPAFIVGINTYY